MARRKFVRFQAVSRTSDSYRRSGGAEGQGADGGSLQLGESGHEYRHEYAYETSWVEICEGDSRADQDRRLNILLRAVGADLAPQFEWVAETDTIQTYEHRVTYRYLHIDGVTGEFCDQQRIPTSRERALAYALPRSEGSTFELATTNLSFELLLGTFLRRGSSGLYSESPGSFAARFELSKSVRWMRVLAQVYQRIWMKMLANRERKDIETGSRERQGSGAAPRGGSEENELCLAAFTRRAA